MIETCRDCALFIIYPSPKYDMGICEETRYIMAPEAPACNYFTPWKWPQDVMVEHTVRGEDDG